MNVFGYSSENTFDQSLNTDDSVSFASVIVSDAITLPQQLATRLYVDTHGGSGGGNMNFVGGTPATNYLYKGYTADGLNATRSSITDTGSLVRVSNPLKCTSLDGLNDSGSLEIGNTQDIIDFTSTYGITANKVVINAGTNQEYMMADGSLLTSSSNAGNSNFYLYNNINGISSPPPANGDVGYNATTLATTSIVYISHRTRDGIDIDVYLALINTLNDLYLQDQSDSTNFAKFNIISAPTLIPNSYISIPVTQSGFGGNGNTAFGAGHNILVSFFSNTPEIDSRLSALELKTQNQTAVSLITTFNDTVTSPNVRVQAINCLTGNPLDSISIGIGDYSVKLDAVNGVKAYRYELYSGTSSQFLKGDGVPDTNTYLTTSSASSTYLPKAGGTVTGTIDMVANKITSTYVPTNSADLCNKTYVDGLIGTSIQGMPFNSIYGNTTTAQTGTRALWYTAITPYATTINGIMMYVDGGGSDTCHFGIYRGYLKAGVGTNPGLNMTLVGQSASSTILTTGLPFNRVPIVVIGGQSLAFTAGSYLTIAFHTSGTLNTFLSSPVAGSSFANLCFTSSSNYATTTFPATVTNSIIGLPSTQRICFDLY